MDLCLAMNITGDVLPVHAALEETPSVAYEAHKPPPWPGAVGPEGSVHILFCL